LRNAAPDSKAEAIDRAYEEFCRRREAGEDLDPDAFCDGFPTIADSLRKVLNVLCVAEAHADLVCLPEEAWPRPGDFYLGLRLERELGRGGFARVFLATEPALGDRQVAVKVAYRGNAEARTLGRLGHRNVVPVHSIKEDEATGLTAVCMPYLGSATLLDVLNRVRSGAGPLPEKALPEQASAILDIIHSRPGVASWESDVDPALCKGPYVGAIIHLGAQLADALAYVHERGILHRDLKPSNVLLTPEGRPMLLDFNLALDRAVDRHRLGGTLPYMAPEHLRATFLAVSDKEEDTVPPVDERSDLFALGVILYELLAGFHPFGPGSLRLPDDGILATYLCQRQEQGARSLHLVNPQVGGRLAHLIDRCLAVDPAERPSSARELAGELRRSQRGLGHWVARHAMALFLVLLLLGTAVSGGTYWLSQPAPPAARLMEDGKKALLEGRPEAAESLVKQALEQDPDSVPLLLLLARAQTGQGKTFEAEATLKKANERGVSGEVHAFRAYNVLRMPSRSVPDALLFNKRALEVGYEENAILHNNLAYCCLRRNELALAEKSLERAVELDRSLQAAWLNRVFLEMMQTRRCPDYLPLRGIEYFQEALRHGPVDGDSYHHAAVLCAAVAGRGTSWSMAGSWALVATRLADQEERRPPGPRAPAVPGVLAPREYEALAVSYLKEAVASGCPVDRIQKDILLRSLLAARPELAELKGNGIVVPPRPLYLDPLAGR
jgi:tetratricopeptide (TPR) repeat protein